MAKLSLKQNAMFTPTYEVKLALMIFSNRKAVWKQSVFMSADFSPYTNSEAFLIM
ncbi:hypothetical protein [Sulfolobus acidocaldarius]|uniref:hypothetical protein n=1 Tax=Sulfolobus acidocaldarius TaxID=2285 RepID=UPI000B079259|nr:hypothetical protein [Sulfolobus acidocaldarius]